MDERRPADEPTDQDAPTGGDETTEEQLQADNAVEEDMLKTLDPDAAAGLSIAGAPASPQASSNSSSRHSSRHSMTGRSPSKRIGSQT